MRHQREFGSVGVALLNRKGEVVYLNDAASRSLGKDGLRLIDGCLAADDAESDSALGRAIAAVRSSGTALEDAERTLTVKRRTLRPAEQLSTGKSTREAASELGIRHETVRTHLKQLMAKLSVSSQAELVKVLLLLNSD